VEIDAAGLTWIKSSMSGGSSASCLEAAKAGDHVVLRCSHDRTGARLSLPRSAWTTLVSWLI